ncbi:MAG: ABC transporter ATPase [Bacteroidia bacterium]
MKELSEDSKVWVYQSDKDFTSNQISVMESKLNAFCVDWTAHDKALKADFEILYNRFIILAVDEGYNSASGCSIDKSVNFMKTLGAEINCNLFERMEMAFLENDSVKSIHFNKLSEALSSNKVNEESLFFDTLIKTKAQLKDFLIPLKQHWLMQRVKV